jgi:hypothetical protein
VVGMEFFIRLELIIGILSKKNNLLPGKFTRYGALLAIQKKKTVSTKAPIKKSFDI